MKQNKSSQIIIGVNSTEYNEKRNFIDSHPKGWRVRKLRDFMKMVDFIYFKIRKKNHTFFHNTYLDARIQKANIFHFYNTVLIGRRPWVVTFENEIPRHNTKSEFLFKKLAGKSCKRIIAMSKNALNIERYYLSAFPKYEQAILEKVVLIAPPQKLHTNGAKPSKIDTIRFIFVGGAFFHKGGKELVHAFLKAKQTFSNIHLTIVSSFAFTHWYDTHVTNEDIQKIKQLLERNKDAITYFSGLPNDKIISLFKESHVSVLPSYGETYGYVVLEAQACGCPVITTNAWAFNEFNNSEIGWILDLPTIIDRGGLKFDLQTVEKRRTFSELLEQRLLETIKKIATNTSQINQKSELVIKHIRENHCPKIHQEKIGSIYFEALGI